MIQGNDLLLFENGVYCLLTPTNIIFIGRSVDIRLTDEKNIDFHLFALKSHNEVILGTIALCKTGTMSNGMHSTLWNRDHSIADTISE